MNKLGLRYQNILEYVPSSEKINLENIKKSELYDSVLNFINENNINNVLISLSGGVDSMVLTEIINIIKNEFSTISLVCCHLNYNNRDESVVERDFLKEYCNEKNIIFDFKDIQFKRGDIKRNLYEKETRDIRYNYYKEMCDKYNCSGVMLAHHKDDICENIFNNIMRGGREVTDLTVIREKNNILGVEIYRPMLEYYKDSILNIAHGYQIPYFLDTTPDWSCRGKMRRNIFPTCEDCYSVNYKKNLLKLGDESDIIGEILEKYIITRIYNSIIFEESNVIIPLKYNDELIEPYILKIIMRKICYKIQIDNMKAKSIEYLANFIKERKIGKIKLTLIKNYNIHILEDKVILSHVSK